MSCLAMDIAVLFTNFDGRANPYDNAQAESGSVPSGVSGATTGGVELEYHEDDVGCAIEIDCIWSRATEKDRVQLVCMDFFVTDPHSKGAVPHENS